VTTSLLASRQAASCTMRFSFLLDDLPVKRVDLYAGVARSNV
jgi:hypothetical protein